VQSTNDTVVYPQQALELAWDLAANGVPHRLVMVRRGGHSFDDPGASLTEAQVTNLIVEYFLKTLVFHSTSGLADGSSSS
jgi:dipeptidyl aminopeptidase/acylaminoacyl peptidase